MQTVKNTINPNMLKSLAAIPASNKQAVNPYAIQRGGMLGGGDDVHMKTVARQETTKQRQLEMWERELLEKPDMRRKATVAQICKRNCLS